MLGPVMLGVMGTKLNEDDILRIKHPLTGGVILFTRNYENRAQLMALTSAIRRVRKDILIAVDHEGGRVQRFREDGFTHLPAMRHLGELWDKDPVEAKKMATSVAYVLAAELRACDIDLSFTPVLDLDYGTSDVIGNRAFHSDEKIVSALAKSLNHGLLLAGMANCGKHFPGHGYVKADSHTEIPVDYRTLKEVMAKDIKPYGWLGISLLGVMPGHVIYPEVDNVPAGFSKKWINILRHEIGFDGVIFSDDLGMHGASVMGGVVEAANAALLAGCDMVLICNSPDETDEILAGLHFPDQEKLKISAAKIASLLPKTLPLSWEALQKEARYINAKKQLKQLESI